MIENLENIFLDYNNKLKYVLVYGDTNSTFAAALSAADLRPLDYDTLLLVF